MFFLYPLIFVLWMNGFHCYTNGNFPQYAVFNESYKMKCPLLINEIETVVKWQISNRKRFEILNDDTLIIHNVHYDDSGQYTCHVYMSERNHSATIDLIVQGPPNKIYDLQIIETTLYSLGFSWNISVTESNPVEYFNVTLCSSSTVKTCQYATIHYPTLFHKFKALQPYTTYVASVVAGNRIGYSEQIELKTGTVINCSQACLSFVRIVSSWESVSVEIVFNTCGKHKRLLRTVKNCMISITNLNDKSDSVDRIFNVSNEEKLEFSVIKVIPNSTYSMSITVWNIFGICSEHHRFCTLPVRPHRPINFTTRKITATTVEIIWQPNSDDCSPITGYVLTVYIGKEYKKLLGDFMLKASDKEFVLRNLESETLYYVELVSVNNGRISECASVIARTREDGFRFRPATNKNGGAFGVSFGFCVASFLILCYIVSFVKRRFCKPSIKSRRACDQFTVSYLPIPISDIAEHIEKCRLNDGAGFKAEFEAVKNADPTDLHVTDAKLKENLQKNRYEIVPYDENRVFLKHSNIRTENYINASFVGGYAQSNAYIATQMPLEETIKDFWQMVLEQKCEIIVMIIKDGKYWSSKPTVYGNIHVRQIYKIKRAFFIERRFEIYDMRYGESHLVHHYRYTDWRVQSIPPSILQILIFIQATVSYKTDNSAPIIVQSLAGVGRAGTYICIDSQIKQMEAENQISVIQFLEHIRKQRMSLVYNVDQYSFIYDALYEHMLCPNHKIWKDQLSDYIRILKDDVSRRESLIENQYETCVQFKPNDVMYAESRKSFNVRKNRSSITPTEYSRIILSTEDNVDGSDYINASAIQGYWHIEEFIITQHPLEDTVCDFWKMIWDKNSEVMVLLSDENLPVFWPTNEEQDLHFPSMDICYCKTETKDNLQYRLMITSSTENRSKIFTIYRLKRWLTNAHDSNELLQLLFEVNSKRYKSSIVVVDENGGNRAGIFVAMSSLLNQLRNDNIIDVYYVLKMIHFERPNTFSSSADFELVYELLEYVTTNRQSFTFFTESNKDTYVDGVSISLVPDPIYAENILSIE